MNAKPRIRQKVLSLHGLHSLHGLRFRVTALSEQIWPVPNDVVKSRFHCINIQHDSEAKRIQTKETKKLVIQFLCLCPLSLTAKLNFIENGLLIISLVLTIFIATMTQIFTKIMVQMMQITDYVSS